MLRQARYISVWRRHGGRRQGVGTVKGIALQRRRKGGDLAAGVAAARCVGGVGGRDGAFPLRNSADVAHSQ
jgi:hypothetical protein